MRTNKRSFINLLPKEDFERTTLGRVVKWALTSFRFIVIVVELVVIAGFLFRFWLDIEISNLDDEITQKSALIASKFEFEKEFRTVQKKIAIYKSITDSANQTLPVFQKISDNLPIDAQLVSFTKEGSIIRILGSSLSENSIAGFLSLLEKDQSFESVVLNEISADANYPYVKFGVELILAKKGGQNGK